MKKKDKLSKDEIAYLSKTYPQIPEMGFKVVDVVSSLVQAITKAMSEGRLSFRDAWTFLPVFLSLGRMMINWKKVYPSVLAIQTLNEKEWDKFVAFALYFAERYQLPPKIISDTLTEYLLIIFQKFPSSAELHCKSAGVTFETAPNSSLGYEELSSEVPHSALR